MIIIERNRR